MNNKEKQILLDTYKDNFNIHFRLEIDKTDILRELKFLLDKLELKKDRYIVENEIISEIEGYNYLQKQMFEMIFDTFSKHNRLVNYNIPEIEDMFEDLQYKMSEEEIKYYNSQINNIMSY